MKTKGKRIFTRREEDEIRKLLRAKPNASGEAQKRIRRKIRGLGFKINDFRTSSSGFTAADFDRLVRDKRITIIGSEH